jgi:hypothetical protein
VGNPHPLAGTLPETLDILTFNRSVTKVTEGITRGMGKLTFDSEYQNQMASREKAQNVRVLIPEVFVVGDTECSWATACCRA